MKFTCISRQKILGRGKFFYGFKEGTKTHTSSNIQKGGEGPDQTTHKSIALVLNVKIVLQYLSPIKQICLKILTIQNT